MSQVRFQGIFRFQESPASKNETQVLRKYGHLEEDETFVGNRISDERHNSDYFNSSSTIQDVNTDGIPVLTGVLVTEDDNADFWVTQYPDQFKKEEFEELKRLETEQQAAFKAYEPYGEFMDGLTLGGWAVRKLSGNKRLQNAKAAEQRIGPALRACSKVGSDLFSRQCEIKFTDPAFTQKLLDYVESHPTAIDGQKRVDELV